MIFSPENIEKVLSGQKTMTRRVVKPDDTINRQPLGDGGEFGVIAGRLSIITDKTHIKTVHRDGRLKYALNHEYAICPGRGKKAVGRIRITAIRREKLQDINWQDAIREGVSSSHPVPVNGFYAIWNSLYGNDPTKGWVSDPDVWVLSFELVK